MRLDKFLSNATDLSRNEVKRLIKAGEISVNDLPVKNSAMQITGDEEICIDNAPVLPPRHRYFMMNKPAGVVSANKDRNHPTAIGLIYEHRHQELQIAGRLDIDTTGLLLITDDGQWNHRITSPRSDCKKTYRVQVDEVLTEDLIDKFAKGIWLEREKRRCLSATLEILDPNNARLIISEGKYHQVKRMLAAEGYHVTALHRERIGKIVLDEALPPGEYRPLTDIEIQGL